MIAYFIGGSRDLSKQSIIRADRWLQFYRPCSFGTNKIEVEHYIYVTQVQRQLDAAMRPDGETTHIYALSHVTLKQMERSA